MFGRDLVKHFREFSRYFRNHQYEVTESGVLFPRAHAFMAGIYDHWVTGYESGLCRDFNVIPTQGQNHLLDVAFKGGTAVTSWYLGLHSGTGAESAAVTAATYNATYSEIQAQSGDPGGYTSATRVLWNTDAIDTANATLDNDTTKAAFTVSTTTTLVVNGAWLTSKSGRTDYTGYAMSVVKFSATRNLADTDVFNLKYTIDLNEV